MAQGLHTATKDLAALTVLQLPPKRVMYRCVTLHVKGVGILPAYSAAWIDEHQTGAVERTRQYRLQKTQQCYY